jgi:hypothetical protein
MTKTGLTGQKMGREIVFTIEQKIELYDHFLLR